MDNISDTPFNMAMLFYEGVHELRNLKNRAATQCNIPLWYNCLRTIYRDVKFKFSNDEKKQVDELFKEASKFLFSSGNTHVASLRIKGIAESRAAAILDVVDSEITSIMNRYHMIFPKIEARGLDTLRKKYGLDGNDNTK